MSVYVHSTRDFRSPLASFTKVDDRDIPSDRERSTKSKTWEAEVHRLNYRIRVVERLCCSLGPTCLMVDGWRFWNVLELEGKIRDVATEEHQEERQGPNTRACPLSPRGDRIFCGD